MNLLCTLCASETTGYLEQLHFNFEWESERAKRDRVRHTSECSKPFKMFRMESKVKANNFNHINEEKIHIFCPFV